MLTLAGGCAGVPSAPASAARASATVQQQIAKDGGIAWDRARPLRWADFQGTPPETGVEGAQTGYSLLYGVSCTGAAFESDVSSVFVPARSWVRTLVLANPEEARRTLRHEQTHFDLTEVHARRLRKVLHDIYDPCRAGRADVPREAERIIAAEADMQRRYDEETRHGLDAARQRAWDQDVAGWLSDLEAFAESRP
jgi:hypothetical protein